MGILTDDMKRVVREQRLGFAATVCPDGTPNLSPKGTTTVWDDDHLVFAHICSPGTMANLRHNPAIEINVVDPVVRKGYRFKGTATVLISGRLHEDILAFYRGDFALEREIAARIQAIVLVKVERALPLISPAYDSGAGEEEITTRWERYWDMLRLTRRKANPPGGMASDSLGAERDAGDDRRPAMITIRPAIEEDFPAILALVEQNRLPKDGLHDHLSTALVAVDDKRIVGSAALEMYGPAALLRSVAVEQAYRNRGLGHQLTRSTLGLALQRGVTAIFLLTETAQDFFTRFGFRPIPRGDVVLSVQRSVEFTTACPESAQAMVLRLTEAG